MQLFSKIIWRLCFIIVPAAVWGSSDTIAAVQSVVEKILGLLTGPIAKTIAVIAIAGVGMWAVVMGGSQLKQRLITVGIGGGLVFAAQTVIDSIFSAGATW